MLIYLLMIISSLLVLSIALGEGVDNSIPRSEIPDSRNYAHYWDIRREKSQSRRIG